jgi:rhomboid protease GluP
MFNEPPPSERRSHPLERKPAPQFSPPQSDESSPPQRVMLHLPAVKPYATYLLLFISIAFFVVRALSPQLDDELFNWGANYSPAVLQQGEYYRLLSSMFLHAGIYSSRGSLILANSMHLIFNMYLLYMVGIQIERIFGHVRFALIYLLGGITGSIFSTVFGGPNSASVGASGAVFAIIGAEFIYFYQHRKLFGAAGQAQMRSLITWALINFMFGIATSVAGAQVQIDNWAHLGGLIGGLALAWLIGPNFVPRRHPDDANALIAVDVNPLERRYWVLSLYAAALVALLLVGGRVL